MHLNSRGNCLVLLAVVSVFVGGCEQEPGQPSPAERALGELQAKYEELKETQGTDPVEWAKEDLENLGDWEYRIVEIPLASAGELETELNALGDERWEAFWVTESGGELRVLLKRPSVSYISKLPFLQLGRVITDGGQN